MNVTTTTIPVNVTTTTTQVNVTTTTFPVNVTTTVPVNATTTTNATTTVPLPGAVDEVTIDAGSVTDDPNPAFECEEDCRVIQDFSAVITGDHSGPQFQTARAGQLFRYSFNMIHNDFGHGIGVEQVHHLVGGDDLWFVAKLCVQQVLHVTIDRRHPDIAP